MNYAEEMFRGLAACRLKGAMPHWGFDPLNYTVELVMRFQGRQVRLRFGMRDGAPVVSVVDNVGSLSVGNAEIYDTTIDSYGEVHGGYDLGIVMDLYHNGVLQWM